MNSKIVAMNIEDFREYCISKPGVTEEFPFDETTLVFKVMGKMFALTNLEGDWSLSLKCDPQRAIELREMYPAIQPGYHMNKALWNTVMMDGSLSQKLVFELIDHSYQLVVDKLPLKLKPLSKPLPKRERPGSECSEQSDKELLNMENQKFPSSGGVRGGYYELKGQDYIELIKLLKIMRVSESGGQAKLMVEDGIVYLNGQQESRKRAKLRIGDLVEVRDFKIRIV